VHHIGHLPRIMLISRLI